MSGFVWLLVWLGALGAESAKVLIYQIAYSPSHLKVSGALADLLVKEGHVVDQVSIMYNTAAPSNGSSQIRQVHQVRLDPSPFMTMSHITDPFKFTRHSRRHAEYIVTKRLFCEKLLFDNALLDELKQEKYDVFLSSTYDLCSLALAHHLDIPVRLGYVPTAWDELSFVYLGMPTPPSYVMDMLEDKVFSRPFTLADRLQASVSLLDRWMDEYGIGRGEVDVIRRRFPRIPSMNKLFQRYSYIFFNTNEILDLPRPVTAKIKYIGGVTMGGRGTLPQDLDRVLDKPKLGTVVFSFGSLFKTSKIDDAMKMEFINAFRAFPDHQFIWKLDPHESDQLLFQNASNVVRMEWLPQTELLADPRVKAFISHMGLNSYTELATSGKPVLCIPLFADQFYNTASAVRNGIAVHLPKDRITTKNIVTALSQLLHDKSYSENAHRLSTMMQTRPLKPDQEFLLYFKHALLNPDLYQVLQLDSVDLPFWKYLSLDLLLYAFISLSIFLTLVYISLSRVLVWLKPIISTALSRIYCTKVLKTD